MFMSIIDTTIYVIVLACCVFTLGYAVGVFRKPKRKQTLFVYCPKCKNELISSNSLVEDNGYIVKYKCDKCGNISFWDFASYPIPYLITCADDCEYFYIDKFGVVGCDQECFCDPDTMTLFRKRVKKSVYEE